MSDENELIEGLRRLAASTGRSLQEVARELANKAKKSAIPPELAPYYNYKYSKIIMLHYILLGSSPGRRKKINVITDIHAARVKNPTDKQLRKNLKQITPTKLREILFMFHRSSLDGDLGDIIERDNQNEFITIIIRSYRRMTL